MMTVSFAGAASNPAASAHATTLVRPSSVARALQGATGPHLPVRGLRALPRTRRPAGVSGTNNVLCLMNYEAVWQLQSHVQYHDILIKFVKLSVFCDNVPCMSFYVSNDGSIRGDV